MTVGRGRTESWAWGQRDATTYRLQWTWLEPPFLHLENGDDRTVQLTEWV